MPTFYDRKGKKYKKQPGKAYEKYTEKGKKSRYDALSTKQDPRIAKGTHKVVGDKLVLIGSKEDPQSQYVPKQPTVADVVNRQIARGERDPESEMTQWMLGQRKQPGQVVPESITTNARTEEPTPQGPSYFGKMLNSIVMQNPELQYQLQLGDIPIEKISEQEAFQQLYSLSLSGAGSLGSAVGIGTGAAAMRGAKPPAKPPALQSMEDIRNIPKPTGAGGKVFGQGTGEMVSPTTGKVFGQADDVYRGVGDQIHDKAILKHTDYDVQWANRISDWNRAGRPLPESLKKVGKGATKFSKEDYWKFGNIKIAKNGMNDSFMKAALAELFSPKSIAIITAMGAMGAGIGSILTGGWGKGDISDSVAFVSTNAATDVEQAAENLKFNPNDPKAIQRYNDAVELYYFDVAALEKEYLTNVSIHDRTNPIYTMEKNVWGKVGLAQDVIDINNKKVNSVVEQNYYAD